jgi:gliding motility-associated-like protein
MSSLTKIFKTILFTFVAFCAIGVQAQTITVTISVKEPTCFSWTDGEATATATGGTSPYAYSWSNGQGGGQTVFGVPAGNYSVTVTDAANRQAVKSFTVGQPTLLVPAVAVIGNSCEPGASYTGSGSGGLPPYTYQWRNLANNQITAGANLTTPAMGTYHLSVTDTRGCTMTQVVNVKPLKVMVITKPATCGGACDGSAEAWVDGGTGPLRYLWSNGSTAGIIGPVPGGVYSVTVTDALGCTKVATGTIEEPGIIAPNLSLSGQCSGSATATITPTGGRAPLTIRWSTGAISNTVTNLAQGQYSVTVTDSQGCTKDTVFKVSTGNLGLNITKTNATCGSLATGSATVNVTGGAIGAYSYRWNTGATTASISNLSPNTYTVTVTDGAGCSQSQSVIIQSNGNLAVQTAFTNSVCGGATGTATVTSVSGGTAPYTYSWSNGATTPSVSNLAAGSYTVTVRDASGCSTVANFTIQGQGNLNIAVSALPTSCGASTGTATVTGVSGGTAPYTYAWNTGATAQTISNVRAGVYFVTVTDVAGCTATKSVEVQATNGLQITATNTKADCSAANGTANVTGVTGGTGPYTYLWSTGARTAGVTGLPVGTYTVTVTDATGCTTATTVVINANSNLVLATAVTPSVCGGATGTASVTSVTGGSAPFSYRWHNGGTTATISGLAPGPYLVTVTDATGCTRSTQVEVPAIANFTLAASSSNTICNGATGSASVIVNGGTAPFNYRWSNGATSLTALNLAAGTYTVTVTDNAGCSTSTSVQVIAPTTSFTINSTSTNTACSGPTGTATVTSVTGGNAPYTYKWSNGATTAAITGLAAGTYTVTITDGSGCSQAKQITVSATTTITASLNATNTTCGSAIGAITSSGVAGGTAPYTYSWNNGATTANISNLGVGTYTVTVTDASGCSTSASATVKAIANFVITATTTPSSCTSATGSATVTAVTGGNAPYTYLWSNGATTQTASNLAVGTYTVVVKDARGCETTSGPITVLGATNIVATPSVVNATCGKTNGSIVLSPSSGSAPYAFTWNDGTTARDRLNMRPGTYSVTIADANGCIGTLSNIRIVDTGSVKAQFALQPQSCLGDSVLMRLTNNTTAQSAGPLTYSWLFTGNRTSTVKSPEIYYGTTIGEATLIARSPEGCLDTLLLRFPVDVIKVDVPDTVTTCINTRVTVTANNLNTGFTPKFRWSNGDTTATTGVTPALAGTTKVFVTITNTYGCTKKDSALVIVVPPLGTPDVTWKRDCGPLKIQFTNNSPYANQWRWVFGDPTRPTAGSTIGSPSYIYPNAGTFTVTLIPTLSCLNTVTLPITVSDKDAVSIDAGRDTTVCSNDRITLRATSNLTNFEWSTTRTFTPVSGTGSTLLVTPTAVRNIYFVRSKDTTGCTGIDSIIVDNRTIKIDRTATIDVCSNVNKPLTITNLTATDVIRVVWSPTSLISGFTGGDSLRPIVRTNADGQLIGTYRNQFGCVLRDTITLKNHVFDATAKASVKTIYVNETAILSATPTGTGFTYSWSPSGTLANPNSPTTGASPKSNTTYIVTVTDAFGCQDTGQVALAVLTPQCAEPYVFIPRAFSPNGDGTNDQIYVHGDYLTTVEFVIFNRWGEQVFATTDKSIGWDGKHKGSPVCPDVYGYYVKGTCQQGEQFFKKGNITVLK